jgi:hypothetical protein
MNLGCAKWCKHGDECLDAINKSNIDSGETLD